MGDHIGVGGRRECAHPVVGDSFPHSLGLLYSAFTYYTGFKVNSGEYKVMGLAPYGEPKYVKAIYENLIDLKPDGTFRLNLNYFNYCTGLTMTNGQFDALFGGPPRKPESPLTQRDMDLARSIQEVTEEVMLRLARTLHTRNRPGQPVPGGGRGAELRRKWTGPAGESVHGLWIQPAAGDAGGALGAASGGVAWVRETPTDPQRRRGCHARELLWGRRSPTPRSNSFSPRGKSPIPA